MLRSPSRRFAFVSTLILGLLSVENVARAAHPEADSRQSTTANQPDSVLTLAPYAWLPNLSGSVGFANLSVPLQLRADQLFKDVQTGGMGYARWQKQARFVYAEGIFMDFSTPSFAPFFGESVDASLRFAELGVGMQQTVAVFSRSVLLSFYGGAHYTRIRANVSGPLLNAGSVDRWLDPALGALAEMPLSPKLTIIGKLDGAGFGVTRNHYYSALGVLEYRVTPRASLAGGYRWSRAHYVSSDGLGFVLEGQGPIVGLRYLLPL